MRKLVKRTIAGREITLYKGVTYLATRPAVSKKNQLFDVTIRPIEPVEGIEPIVFEQLSYDEANALINEFNNGSISFLGRKW